MAHARTPVEVKSSAAGTPDVWRSFRSEMDRLFDRFALPSWSTFPSFPSLFETAPSFSFNAPAVDIAEEDKAYKIAAELPGLDEKDVDVSVNGDLLVLKGEKRQEKEEKGKNMYVCERSYGSFQRAFSLPDGIDRNKISADFSKGVLTVTLPKSAEAQKQQKKVEIKAH
ncbi:MAG TPA: Hsp20/alpha crystallin family protein [Stellaceae bacterium]|jgi:HSP20 family protein|nr:Hsp20/alpha crystallin family protein [Stellaceae bacterium]